jgi:hypothetical protein
MGLFTTAVLEYLDDCDALAGLLSRKYHPTENGAVKAIFHRGPDEADEIRATFREESRRPRPSRKDGTSRAR